jgi:hypothetical protein
MVSTPSELTACTVRARVKGKEDHRYTCAAGGAYLMLHQPGPYLAWPSFAWATLDRLHQQGLNRRSEG